MKASSRRAAVGPVSSTRAVTFTDKAPSISFGRSTTRIPCSRRRNSTNRRPARYGSARCSVQRGCGTTRSSQPTSTAATSRGSTAGGRGGCAPSPRTPSLLTLAARRGTGRPTSRARDVGVQVLVVGSTPAELAVLVLGVTIERHEHRVGQPSHHAPPGPRDPRPLAPRRRRRRDDLPLSAGGAAPSA